MNELKNKPCCLNCKYWENDEYVLQGFDANIYRVCNKADEIDGMMQSICCSEGIAGELVTRQDFGCVIFNKN